MNACLDCPRMRLPRKLPVRRICCIDAARPLKPAPAAKIAPTHRRRRKRAKARKEKP